MNFPTLRILSIANLAFVLSACTTLEPPMVLEPLIGYDMVDLARVDVAKYTEDHKQCAAIANQDITDVTRVASRVLGTAADRASMGVIGQRQAKDADRSTVLKRCLTGRGYNVLR